MTDRAKPTSTAEAENSEAEISEDENSVAKGSVNEAIGKLTGDARVADAGKAQKHPTRPSTAPRHGD